uniref:SRCR domain-containing protein n=1 Tax=Oreochromis aureus TaxID=47969 RepID=A0A668U0G3_OREAU
KNALNGKWTDSYIALFYSPGVLKALYTTCLIHPHSYKLGKPRIEPPTFQSVADLLYHLSHRVQAEGKHNSTESAGKVDFKIFRTFFLSLMSPDSVRLLNGSSLCSGRLEVKSNQSWSSVCEADFDQQDAEVVCRELGCGPPSVLQGALYGEVEAPVWSKEFQCGGHESALLDCRSSGSARNSCSPGKAVGLTCSEPDYFRLVGGANRCSGILEFKLGVWRPLIVKNLAPNEARLFCQYLDCGSVVSLKNKHQLGYVWEMSFDRINSGSPRDCAVSHIYSHALDLKCSGKRAKRKFSATEQLL